DPREFTIIAFGGNGPLHACAVAEELGIRSVLVPASPGVFSAFGLTVAPLQSTATAPIMQIASEISDEELHVMFETLTQRAAAELTALLSHGADAFEAVTFTPTLDMRYQGQSYELNVPAKHGISENIAAFHEAHARAYGYSVSSEAVEVVNLRLTATAPRKTMPYRFEAHAIERAARERRVWFDGAWNDVPVVSRNALSDAIKGPAIVDEYDGTTLIPRRWTATLHEDVLQLGALE
ncbi:MAG: hydantoinase/oxoprolinase family protein, partial [Candidatus Eremiobacteraeota bacterium]|nr:hydantoinase/oxoprolinase family protein [Candidatus Eremiobacteraeota bacterium]